MTPQFVPIIFWCVFLTNFNDPALVIDYTGGEGHLPSGYLVSSLWVLKQLAQSLPTLGARGHLPSGYIVSSLWVLKQFAQSLPSRYMVSFLKSTHQSTQWVLFERNPWVYFKRTHQITQQVLFERTLWVLSKVPINLIKMYLADSFQSTHNELSIWSSFTTNSQRTCQVYGWVLSDQIDGYFLKELRAFVQKVPAG